MDNNYILQMKNIRITFGALVANDNVNLNVKKGTVHALIGENGAGKSTLMNVLTGILRPDCGEIILNGEEVTFKNSLDAAKHGIGMVYQEFMLFNDLTVFDNVVDVLFHQAARLHGLIDVVRKRGILRVS